MGGSRRLSLDPIPGCCDGSSGTTIDGRVAVTPDDKALLRPDETITGTLCVKL